MLRAQAAHTPDAQAVVFEDHTLTYAQLQTRADALARRLVALGAGPERRVALILPRSLDWVIAARAVLETGAAYVPIDPTYPTDRIAHMLADSTPVCVLTLSEVADALPELPGVARLVLDEPQTADSDIPAPAPADEHRLMPDHPAYVIYTSGTTGRPKGVVVSHGAIVNQLRWHQSVYGLTSSDRVLQQSATSFDASVFELFWPLLYGATAVLAQHDGQRDPAYLARLIQREHVTLTLFVPSLLQAFLEQPEAARCTSLRAVIAGGEALSQERRNLFVSTLDTDLYNHYGPTEAAIATTYWKCASDGEGPVPIGRPVHNTRAYVLDTWLRPVPPGAEGELYLAGVQLARGYLGRSALTAERFVADPYGPPGSRMYRTGDLARRRADGALECLGRADDQVKVNGFRIELGEIESVLVGHPSVADAAVVLREDRPGHAILVGYVVPAEATAPAGEQDLRAFASGRLPVHMVPAALVTLPHLPVTSHGKLDRKALPAPEFTRRGGGRGPRTPHEAALCAIFSDILGLDPVGIDDDFFDLGGHSLLATRLANRVRGVLGVELAIRTIYEAPTVAGLAERLNGDGPARPRLTRAAVPELAPLSPVQRRLWFMSNLEGPSSTYNIPAVLRLRGALNVEALRAALADLVERHLPLRSRFPDTVSLDGDEPCLVVLDTEQAVPAVPVRSTTAGQLPEFVEAAALHPFDLTVELPLHVEMFRLAPDHHVLALVVHHIAADGWSIPILARDLSEAYAARTSGRAPGWEPLPVQYTDYTLWQRKLLGDEDAPESLAAQQIDFWRRELAGIPDMLALPVDRQRPARASHRGGTVPFEIPAEVHAQLAALARSRSASVFIAVQAGLAALLTRLGAGTDIPLGTVVAGRTDEALEGLVGFFVNTLVLRTDTSGDPDFVELLDRARDVALEAYAHQDIPFDRVVDALNVTRSLSHHPLFQVALSAPPATGEDTLRLAGLDAEFQELQGEVAKFDLSFHITERFTTDGAPDGVAASVEYSSDLFDRGTAEQMASRLVRLLTAAVTDPSVPTGRLEVLSDAERHRMLADWTGAEAAMPKACLAEVFAAQAARTPKAEAVVWEGGSLAYDELDQLSNRVAHHLAGLGVRAEEGVALLLDRSPHLIVAMIGVLKAGGFYVPLDERSPRARIETILQQTGCRVVLTDRDVDSRLPAGLTTLRVPGPTDVTDEPAAPRLAVRVSPDQTAYVMYTSGTTGLPKGIATTHRGVLGLALDQRWRGSTPERFLFHAPHAFDASTCEIWVPLLGGGAVVLPRPGAVDPAEIRRSVAERGVTRLHLTAGLFRTIVEEDPGCLAGLREVFTGGDTIPPSAVRAVLAEVDGVRLTAGYGPTEITMFATSNTITAHTPPTSTTPLGRPRDGLRIHILDRNLQPVPPGVVGEMYLAGHGLARGYLGQPALTSERFVAAPFGPDGSRMYRTGDLFCWHSDGTLEHLGRVDDQVKIRGFRIELGEVESVMAAFPGISDCAVAAHPGQGGEKQLVGYFVRSPGNRPDTARLREYLAGALPEYSVPTSLLPLDALPLTPNGKLDRKALPLPQRPTTTAGAVFTDVDSTERTLTSLFQELLGLAHIGVDDNFFGLGGDSIMSIQLASRARKAGLDITPKDIFEHQTVAALAALCAGPRGGADATAPDRLHHDDGVGQVPLTPVLHRLREQPGLIDGAQQTVLLTCPAGLGEEELVAAVQAVMDHHDALRMRLTRSVGGLVWALESPAPGTVSASELVRRVDVSDVEQEELEAVRAAEALSARERISSESGIMLQAVWFDAGSARPGQLFLAVHHLAVDGVSWRILLPDIIQAWQAAAEGRQPELEPVPTSFRRWAQHLNDRAHSPQLLAELPYWVESARQPDALLGCRPFDPAMDTGATAGTLTRVLPTEVTGPLLGAVPSAFHGTVNDVLLAALATALVRHHPRDNGFLFELEGHGRDETVADVDLSRTVGWFTSLHPVRLDPGDAVPTDPVSLARAVKRVKEQLRAVPGNGLAHGLLRHLNPQTAPLLATAPRPQIGFNYLGRATVSQPVHGWELDADRSGLTTGAPPAAALAHALEANVVTLDGPDGPELSLTMLWAGGVLSEEQVCAVTDTWCQALRNLAGSLGQAGIGGHTPSDFPLVRLDQSSLDELLAGHPDAQDVLPLSPLQEEMLCHTTVDEGAPDVYTNCIRLGIAGPLNDEALRGAWHELLERHAVLRTAFVRRTAEGGSVAMVVPVPALPWETVDLSHMDTGEQQRELARLMAVSRTSRFAPDRPPLLRVLLARLGEERHSLILTIHHIIADGWSLPVLLRELFTVYDGRASELPPAVPYRRYLDWLADQDRDAARTAWRQAMDGVEAPSLVAPQAGARVEVMPADLVTELSAADTEALRRLAASAGLTLGTLTRGAWALLLAGLTGSEDVVFGTTSAARPAQLPGVESMVGLFMNTLPTRVRLTPDRPLLDILRDTQAEQYRLADHEFLSQREVADLTGHERLFDTLLVFENYPFDQTVWQLPGGLRIDDADGLEATPYPLSLTATPGERLHLRLGYRPDVLDHKTATAAADQLLRILQAIATDAQRPAKAFTELR
ncbi:amino acid adenylation domain-containing protein [Streptomyces sp. NPDC057271]|uniref:amino acid adenylation domain-containing protein n=1 Tax=Streptomyces sp. NPDC057271 TaxID=3346078 RepID=UPI00362CB8EE